MSDLVARGRIRGCLLGGAVGDALGAPVEFLSLAEIRRQFGPSGIEDFAPAYGGIGRFTDDTQMTLFTAEGLLRAWVRQNERGICGAEGVIHHAYMRWLLTQGERPRPEVGEIGTDGWLFAIPALHDRRGPGNTCLSALASVESKHFAGRAGNDSKGCGGVMRAAPVGLFAPYLTDDAAVFDLAAAAAALTHGHPSGFLSAGTLAVIVAALLRDEPLDRALDAADRELVSRHDHAETRQALSVARTLAAQGRPTPEAIESLGGGWVGEEALAIAVCCALVARDFSDGVRLAANHSGDSDSTAAIAGNILGALCGEAAIPATWLDRLELRAEIATIADDLHAATSGTLSPETARERYPGW